MIDWEQDWTKASVKMVAEAVAVLANATGGVEQDMLDAAAYHLGNHNKLIRCFTGAPS